MKSSIFSLIIFVSPLFSSPTIYAYDIPENHYEIIDELECLSAELEKQWKTITYDSNDPNTWVLCDWWSKHRGKIIGTVIAPGIGTIIGHQVDVADNRAQSDANARKAAEAAAHQAQMAAAEAARQRAEAERIHQDQMRALEEQRRAEQAVFEAEKQELKSQLQQLLDQVEIIKNQVPQSLIDGANYFADTCREKIKIAKSVEEAYSIFIEYQNILNNLFKFKNK